MMLLEYYTGGYVQQLQFQWIVIFALILAFYFLANFFFVPNYLTQFIAGALQSHLLIDNDGIKMIATRGTKTNPGNILYKASGGFFGNKRIKYADPTRWMMRNGVSTSVQWGRIPVVRFFSVGKVFPLPLEGTLAAEACHAVAASPVSEDDVKKYEVQRHGAIGVLKDNISNVLPNILQPILPPGVKKVEWTESMRREIIRHNKYLHLIAKASKQNALLLLRCPEGEIDFYAKNFMVLPSDIEKTDARVAEILPRLKEEILMVREYCAKVLPKECNLGTFMAAYPSNETSTEIINKINVENETEKKLEGNKLTYALLGIIGLLVVAIIIIFALKG